ncbi:MAG: CoA-binding protein [bacterium]
MASMKVINDFLATKQFALAGTSRNPKAFSRSVMKDLSAIGFDIIPINPNVEEIDGKKCYKSVTDLPPEIDRLLIMTNKSETDKILEEAIKRGFESIWVQQTADSNKTLEIAKTNNFDNIVTKQCIFMFANPTSIHKFHRFFKKLFGMMPK